MKDDELGELFAKPPAEFTAARNAFAKELRNKGDEEGAKRVLALRRPTAALWAANQLARRDPGSVDALVETTDRMRKLQEGGAGFARDGRSPKGGAYGRGTGDDLRTAMGDQRAALARLESEAEGALREAGLSVSQAVLRTVQRTLQAAATGDRDLREALREGRLESEQEPAGFEALLGAAPQRGATPPARAKKAKAAAPSKAQERKQAAEARRREKEAAKEAARRERELKAAEGLVEKLEQKAQEADRAANEARERAREARNKLHELRSRM